MKIKNAIISILASTLFVGFLTNASVLEKEPPNDGGVFITDKNEKGPIFYPAEYSSEITNEPNYSTQNGYTFSSMNYNNAHKYYRGDSVKVAVIDSGLNYTHEDFSDSNGNQIIQGNSRTIDNSSGKWLYYQFSSGYQSKIVDSLGHGTNVASVIASQINALGCAGIAPNVELYVYKVTNTSNGYEWTAINSALSYCVSEGIDVINMSFQAYEHAVTYNGSTMSASTGCSSVMTSYINNCYNAGITLVAAAGNYNTSEPSYPASNNHVISVGSLAESSTTTKAAYSNTYGIDLVAPGTVYVADKGTNTAYKKTSGTSFSAPIVTAAIALYKQQHPTATPSEIESALYASCDLISGNPSWAGNGRLNIDKFLGVDVQDVPVEIIINNPEVVNEELELEVGDELNLDWTVNGVGTFDDSVNFYTLSGEDNVVTIDSNGVITATGVGEDYIVIESNADSNVYASIYVTVTSSGSSTPTVTSVSVSPSSLSLDLNGTKTGNLSATVNGTNNPSQSVTWSSSNTSVATVSSSGVVTAKATGNATITATSQADGTKSGTCTVTVSDSTVHVTGVTLNKNLTSLTVGSTETLTATVSPNNATNKNVTWSSSNTSVATVSNGTITAVSAGNATITVTTVDGSYTATCTVTVSASGGEESGDYTVSTTALTSSDITSGIKVAWGTSSTMLATGIDSNWVRLSSTSSDWKVFTLTGTSSGFTLSTSDGNVYSSAAKKVEFSTTQSTTMTLDSNGRVVGSGSIGTYVYNASGLRPYSSPGSYTAAYLYLVTYEQVKTLSSISVVTAPTKTTYTAGEYFDPTGLVITRTYSDSTSDTYTYANHTSEFSFSPTTSTALTTSNVSVTITYGGKSCSQAIIVNAAKTLSSISISGQTTSFVEGDTFSFGGTVTAHYSDSTTANVTASATFTGYNMTSVGNQTVTVTYSGKSTTYQINVAMGTLSSIAVSGQTTEYVKNASFSFDGTCIATFANGYQKPVTPTSVTSPDMTTGGTKSITISYTYNGNTRTTTYTISVNSYRTVMEESYSTIGTIVYTSGSEVISAATLSTGSKSGYSQIDTTNKAYRLGSGSNPGSVSVISTTANIYKITANARAYGSDSGVSFSIAGTANTLTSSYADYTKEFNEPVSSVAFSTAVKSKRALIASFTVYTKTSQDIGQSEDCVGLETFINTYMHMDYTENLGYCNDSEHHYYSTAKTAFNALNTHQRSLFTGNTAYLTEWTRLSTWASKNGESLNSNNLLATAKVNPVIANNISSTNTAIIVVVITLTSLAIIGGYIYLRKHKED